MTTDLLFVIEGTKLPHRTELKFNDRIVDITKSQSFIRYAEEFDWGYCGSQPAQSALAIILEAGISFNDAAYLHEDFVKSIIAKIPRESDFRATVMVMIMSNKIITSHINIIEKPQTRMVDSNFKTLIPGLAPKCESEQGKPVVVQNYDWLRELINKDIDRN